MTAMIGGADCASAPAGVYEPATPLDVDAPLMIEPDAIRLPAERHGLGTQASAIRLGVEGANVAMNYAGRPEGVKTRRPAMTRLNVTDARYEALFASGLQRSENPDADMVAEVISHAVRQFGTRGCADRMAQEFGDHPETAADRMRWVRQLVGEVSAPAIAWRASRGGRSPADPCREPGRPAAGSARRAAGSKKSQHASGRDSCGHCTRRAGSMAISRPAEVQAGCGAAKGAEWD
jgi:hypothetical protein